MKSEEIKKHLENTEYSENTEHTEEHSGPHVALKAEEIITVGGFTFTNTLITSWVVILLLVMLAVLVGKKIKLIPSKAQLLFEEAFSAVLNYMEETLGSRKLAVKYFPIIFTIFIFVFLSNLLEFIPGVGSIGFFDEHGFIPLFRSVNTDLNVTLALAIIAFVTIEVAGVTALGVWKYAGKFISFKSPVGFVVGLIELMSEIIRLISFSFRLFGNIFAGEVLIAVVSFLVPAILPVPLMGFEVFVGFVQAVIFSLLTLMFIKLAVQESH